MNILSVRTKNAETGEHEFDWEKLVELLLKLAGIAGVIVGVWAQRQSNHATAVATKAEAQTFSNAVETTANRAFLEADRGSNYVRKVMQKQSVETLMNVQQQWKK